MILFVTDGEPTDSFSDIEATIETGNALESNSVSILTFGVGQGRESLKIEFQTLMSIFL